MVHDDDLADRLTAAASQFSSRPTVEETLDAIVRVAVSSLDGIDHAGITLAHRDGTLQTAAATDDLVHRLDRLQYELGEGPCLTAVGATAPVVLAEHLRHEARWHTFVPPALRLGLRAMVGVRLFTHQGTTGVLNLYATATGTIDHESRHLAELLATHAALAYGHVRQVTDLQAAVATRQLIGQAVGILMERYGLGGDRAFEHLVRLSATEEVKLRDVARAIVEDRPGAGRTPPGAQSSSSPASSSR